MRPFLLRRFLTLLPAALPLLVPQPLLAHSGGAIPADLWSHWNLNWSILAGLLVSLIFYLRGARSYPLEPWRRASFVTALAAIFVALISPLDALSASLFSAHMVQHLLLILIAAPLLVWSRPLAPILRGAPRPWRKTFGYVLQRPLAQRLWAPLTGAAAVLFLHVAALWLWHLPTLYSAALRQPAIHLLEHASFFMTAALYWWMIVNNDKFGGRVLSIFVVMMASGLLGALMTFASTAWYPDHALYVEAWGLTPLEDQQLAGLLMWVPAGILYTAIGALLLGAWLHAIEQRMVRRERRLTKEMSDA